MSATAGEASTAFLARCKDRLENMQCWDWEAGLLVTILLLTRDVLSRFSPPTHFQASAPSMGRSTSGSTLICGAPNTPDIKELSGEPCNSLRPSLILWACLSCLGSNLDTANFRNGGDAVNCHLTVLSALSPLDFGFVEIAVPGEHFTLLGHLGQNTPWQRH